MESLAIPVVFVVSVVVNKKTVVVKKTRAAVVLKDNIDNKDNLFGLATDS